MLRFLSISPKTRRATRNCSCATAYGQQLINVGLTNPTLVVSDTNFLTYNLGTVTA